MKYKLYNDTLNPAIWDKMKTGYKLKPDVRDALKNVALDFIGSYLKEREIEIEADDIRLVGSSANYNYTRFSDIDLHIVTDFSKLDMSKELAEVMFSALKVNWNETHNIKIKGLDVEIYVEDVGGDIKSTAIYSIKDDKWVTVPEKESHKFDKKTIIKKYNEFKNKIESTMESDGPSAIDKLNKIIDKLYQFRQAGLDKGGEFSTENIVFKILRAKGYIDKIKDRYVKVYDKTFSIEENI